MPTVAIVGAGLIGRSWAIVFARAGWDVSMFDPSAEQLAAAPALIRTGLDELAAHGLAADPDGAAQRVSPAVSLEEAVAGADLVQENGPEVELCGAPWTAPETIERAREIYESVGQVPIVVNREVEGFVLNRLQGALLAEAFRLVGEDVVSPQDLDKTLKDGLGLRWSFMGPFETIELNAPGGIADYCRRYAGFYRRLASEPPPPEVWDAG